ncbi:SDR family NAD(P)-dependent oxidoreductase [Hydrogenophaga sp. ZJX-1]|uniref:SDR family NAD(P)-dependent oxidoreductase n=1 Tax=Hydrogenophaga sp. ZJX-1 TaxID=3404778 RepID=UPI003B281D05
MERLKHKIAVVTGAASGMGRGIALKLAHEGACVALLDVQDTTAVRDEILAAGGDAFGLRCDVTQDADMAAAQLAVAERWGRVDILVNNAGILSGRKPWFEHTREDLDRFLQVNFMGYFLITKTFYPLLKKSTAGRVINIASRTYFLANPGQMAYVASKGAVMGMTRVLAKELGEENITVNAVAPGMIATAGTLAHSGEDAFDRVMQNQALKKRGRPEHLASLVAYLASDEAEMITGQMMLCDGGGYLH